MKVIHYSVKNKCFLSGKKPRTFTLLQQNTFFKAKHDERSVTDRSLVGSDDDRN